MSKNTYKERGEKICLSLYRIDTNVLQMMNQSIVGKTFKRKQQTVIYVPTSHLTYLRKRYDFENRNKSKIICDLLKKFFNFISINTDKKIENDYLGISTLLRNCIALDKYGVYDTFNEYCKAKKEMDSKIPIEILEEVSALNK